MNNSFLRNFEELIEAKPNTINGKDVLSSLEGWNSLAVVGFIAMCDEYYNVIIPVENLQSCNTVDDLWKLVNIG